MNQSRLRTKYPRTAHFSFSPGIGEDDIVATKNYHSIIQDREIIITEKYDGENTTLYNDYVHARSIQFSPHPSRAWIRRFWAEKVQGQLSDNMRICGENMYATHSIHYTDLPSYFLVFSIWEGEWCLSWDDMQEWCILLGLESVPVLYRGKYNELIIKTVAHHTVSCGREGIVVRPADRFHATAFAKSVFKYVRENHVQTDDHWMSKPVIPNELKK